MSAQGLKVLVRGAALASAATIVFASSTPAQAHRRMELAVTFGTYVPTSELPVGPWSGFGGFACTDFSGSCGPFTESQRRAVAAGVRVTAWLGARGAIEGSFWYASSSVTGFERIPGNVALGSVRMVFRLAPQAPILSPLLLAGPAVIHRSGDAYSDVRGTTSPGGVLGIGLDIHPGHRFSLRATIEDYLYSVKFASGTAPGVSDWKFQQDAVLSLSVNPFGQRGERH